MINYCNTKEEIAGSISVRIWLGRADQMVNYILLLLLFNDNNNDNDV
jgi:hypothetical protein